MKKFIRIGVDLAKNYFQVHALESENGRAVTRKLKRSKMHEFFSQIEPCLIDGVDGPTSTASKCQNVVAGAPQRGRPSMKQFIRIGVDLAKNSFQVHALESEDGRATKRKLTALEIS